MILSVTAQINVQMRQKNTENRIQSSKFEEHYGSGAPQTSIRWEQSHRKPIENVLKFFSVAKERKKWFQRVTHFCCREKECRTTFGFFGNLILLCQELDFSTALFLVTTCKCASSIFFIQHLKKTILATGFHWPAKVTSSKCSLPCIAFQELTLVGQWKPVAKIY